MLGYQLFAWQKGKIHHLDNGTLLSISMATCSLANCNRLPEGTVFPINNRIHQVVQYVNLAIINQFHIRWNVYFCWCPWLHPIISAYLSLQHGLIHVESMGFPCLIPWNHHVSWALYSKSYEFTHLNLAAKGTYDFPRKTHGFPGFPPWFPPNPRHLSIRVTIRAADAPDLLADAAGLVVRGLQNGGGFVHFAATGLRLQRQRWIPKCGWLFWGRFQNPRCSMVLVYLPTKLGHLWGECR